MDKKLKINFIYNFITQALTVITPLLIAPYISRVLNVSLIGDYNYCYSVVSIFGLFANMGITVYGIPIIAKARENINECSKAFWELMIIKTIFSIASLTFYTIFIIFFVESKYCEYFIIFGLYIVSSYLDITWLFQGFEDFKTICLRTILIKSISIIFTFIFVKDINDMYTYITITMLSLVIPNLLLFFKLKNKINIKKYKIDLSQHLKPIFEMLLPGIAYTVYAMIDKAMIKIITGDTIQVGFYEQAYKIAFVGVTIMSAFSTVLSTRISALKSDNEIKEVHKISYSIICIIALPMFIGLYNLSNYFIPFYYGDGYEGSINILKIFSILPLIMGISNFISYQYFIPKIITKPSMIIITISILINICLNCILIKIYGGLGAAMATIISESFISLLYFTIYTKFQKFSYVFKCIYKYIISGILTYICIYFSINYILQCNSLTIFLFYVFLIILLFITILILMKDDAIMSTIKMIKNKLKQEQENGEECSSNSKL